MARRIDTQAVINSVRLAESAAPSTPGSGYFQVYAKSDGKLYTLNDAGVEVCLTDKMTNPMTTEGDLVLGGASGAPSRLAIGANNYVLTSNGTTAAWAAAAGGSSFVGAHVYRTTNQAINTETWTAVQFDNERYDTNTFHDNSTNNSRLTIPTGKTGYYSLKGAVQWDVSSAGNRYMTFRIDNGATGLNLSGANWISTAYYIQNFTIDWYITQGQYAELFIYQDTGGSLNITQGQFSIAYLGA